MVVAAAALAGTPEEVLHRSPSAPVRHPGWLLQDVLRLMGVPICDAAARMGVARGSLYRVFEGKAPVTAELALRFTRLTGGTPQFYLDIQNDFDLWQARSRLKGELVNIHPLRHSHYPKR